VVIFIHIITLLCMMASSIMSRVVGPTVNKVFTRLLGVVLASLAIQFIGSGIKEMMV
jgi:small neutral amino acid transporter SnatA (MarC family)